MASNEFGILIQGRVSSWTNDIINEYKKNFPDAEIVFSAWKDEDVGRINCKVIQSEKPSPTHPHSSNINLQIIGSREGLKEMSSEVILKCRSDIFIHNKNIFKIFKEKCSSEKIMVPDIGSYPFEYRISDFCLLGTKKVLSDFWNSLEFYDGSYAIAPETYLTNPSTLEILGILTPNDCITLAAIGADISLSIFGYLEDKFSKFLI